MRWVESGSGRLGDVGDALAAHFAAAFGVQRTDIDAAQHHFAPGDVHAGACIAHAREANSRLSRAALPNQAEHLAAF